MIDLNYIKTANKNRGFHWFEPSSMRFFNSRVLPKVYEGIGGIFFVTSEKFDANTPRLFSIRFFDKETGSIRTVGEFQQYTSAKLANAMAEKLAKGEES